MKRHFETSHEDPAGKMAKKARTESLLMKEKGAATDASLSPYLTLHTGALMPQVQFGTYKIKGESCLQSVLSALRIGYRGLDTASVYDNEKEVGQAILQSGIDRSSLFIQTKLWRSFVGAAKNGKPKCDAELRKSLRKLGTDYIDLWLIHWPGPGRHLNYPPVRMGMARPKELIAGNADRIVPNNWSPAMRLDTYRQMCRHVGSAGTVRALGVCNFSRRQLVQLIDYCHKHDLPRPAVVQNECHPYLTAEPVRRYCAEQGIIFQSYASLGAGALDLLDHPAVVAASKDHDATAGQVLLRWAIQHGCAVLPKSVKPSRQTDNLRLWHFKLSTDEMDSLDGMERGLTGQNTMVGWLREHDPDFY